MTWLVAVAVAVGVAGCGGRSTSGVAARVGEIVITRSAVAHWTSIMAGGRRIANTQTTEYRALQTRALDLLISSWWAIGEATDRRLGVSDADVEKRLAEKSAGLFPGGQGEMQSFLRIAGKTVADLRFEVTAELALERLHTAIESSAHDVTRAQIARYFRDNREEFVIPERREVEITNRKSAGEVDQLRMRVAAGTGFETFSQRESVERPPPDVAAADRTDGRTLVTAIFAAKPHVLIGPIRQRVDYYLFEVRGIRLAEHEPLVAVEDAIKRRLEGTRRQQALAGFISVWSERWTAMTDCYPGYVIRKCRQFHGDAKAAHEPLHSF
jgi:foldase protein PrsA